MTNTTQPRKPHPKALELAALLQSMIDDGTISEESWHYSQHIHALGETLRARDAAKDAGDQAIYSELCNVAGRQFHAARVYAVRNRLQPLGEVLREMNITL